MLDKLLRLGEGRMVKRLKRVAEYVNGLSDDIDAPHFGEAGGNGHHQPGRVVRTKEHEAKPMSVDDALYEMELVGHDFFLFYDKQTERPSVVYRRHAYDYGLIRLS